MGIANLVLTSLLLFAIIYAAVRLAISPLLAKNGPQKEESEGLSLSKLKEIGIFSEDDLASAINLYKKGNVLKEFDKYHKVLMDLKDAGHFDAIEYEEKKGLLQKHLKLKEDKR